MGIKLDHVVVFLSFISFRVLHRLYTEGLFAC